MAHEPVRGASCAFDASATQHFAAAMNAMHASARQGVALAADAVCVMAGAMPLGMDSAGAMSFRMQ